MSINTVREIDDLVAVKTVLISVADKTGLEALVEGILSASPGCRILSTGGTHAEISRILGTRAASSLSQVSSYTGQPEMQGGLVKTLDYKIYLGLLSETYNPAHREDLRRFGASEIDMVVSSLYPFQRTVSLPGATVESARGNIDIGGPCMVRAAAKNFHRVAAVTDPGDYGELIGELTAGGGSLRLATRFRLAQKAFALIAEYDGAISGYLSKVSLETMAACYRVNNAAR
jgi:phosphoribosylaminoimidazolecarboxamide formyltransferase/IMP cyclohydrolase